MQHMWKKYDPQSQQNAIQHACKHFATTKNETTKWNQKPPEHEKYIKQEKLQSGTLTQLMKQSKR